MATTTESVETNDAHDDEAHHPSDWEYIKIALLLGFLTALEVGMYFLEDSLNRAALFIGLTVLMIVKFVLVVAYFMHLKYDTPWFRRVFVSGLVLAMSVYAIFFFAFDLFGLG